MIARSGLLPARLRDETGCAEGVPQQGRLRLSLPPAVRRSPPVWKTVNVKLMSSAGAIAALVAILEAGRKWA